MGTLSQLVGIKALEQPNGDLLIATTAGLVLPTHAASGQIQIADATLQPQAAIRGGMPGITLDGNDVTGQLRGGRIGANIALRDTTLPTDQAELDEFAQNLASRFDAQGLTLVHRSGRATCRRMRGAAGAERLCRLRRHHPGQSGGSWRRRRWCATAPPHRRLPAGASAFTPIRSAGRPASPP